MGPMENLWKVVFHVSGWDVHGNQFDLQIAAGGTGAFNNCAGREGSMFPGGEKAPGGLKGELWRTMDFLIFNGFNKPLTMVNGC